jgi:hypothetical protein
VGACHGCKRCLHCVPAFRRAADISALWLSAVLYGFVGLLVLLAFASSITCTQLVLPEIAHTVSDRKFQCSRHFRSLIVIAALCRRLGAHGWRNIFVGGRVHSTRPLLERCYFSRAAHRRGHSESSAGVSDCIKRAIFGGMRQLGACGVHVLVALSPTAIGGLPHCHLNR